MTKQQAEFHTRSRRLHVSIDRVKPYLLNTGAGAITNETPDQDTNVAGTDEQTENATSEPRDLPPDLEKEGPAQVQARETSEHELNNTNQGRPGRSPTGNTQTNSQPGSVVENMFSPSPPRQDFDVLQMIRYAASSKFAISDTFDELEAYDSYVLKVIKDSDRRANSAAFIAAKQNVVAGIR